MISAASGFINQSEKYSRENAGQSLKKYTLLKEGELAYNHGASKLRQFGCCFELKEKAARIPYVYHTFSIDKKEYAPYIALLLNNPIMDRQLKRLVSSSVRMDGLLNISYDEYMSVRLNIPILKTEQEKLYSFIEKLDQRIEKQRQLVELFKSYKRGVLEHYFSRQIILTDPTEKWSKCHIKDCLNYEQPQKYIVTSEHYSNEYSTPVLTANKAFVLGYTAETDGIYDKGQVIIYDDFTMEAKFVEFPFKVKSSTIKMLTPKNGNNLYFLFCLLQHLKLKPEGHQRSYISIVEPMDVSIPSIKEQNRASELFYTLNRFVKFEEENLTHFESEKAGLLQQLFI